MIFINFTEWYNHLHKSVLEHFHLPSKISYAHFQLIPIPFSNSRQSLVHPLSL